MIGDAPRSPSLSLSRPGSGRRAVGTRAASGGQPPVADGVDGRRWTDGRTDETSTSIKMVAL